MLATLAAVPSAHRGKPVGKSASSIELAEIDPLINGVSVVLAGAEGHSGDKRDDLSSLALRLAPKSRSTGPGGPPAHRLRAWRCAGVKLRSHRALGIPDLGETKAPRPAANEAPCESNPLTLLVHPAPCAGGNKDVQSVRDSVHVTSVLDSFRRCCRPLSVPCCQRADWTGPREHAGRGATIYGQGPRDGRMAVCAGDAGHGKRHGLHHRSRKGMDPHQCACGESIALDSRGCHRGYRE